MNKLKKLREDPRLLYALGLFGCAAGACLLAAASFNGVHIPLNTALTAALPPVCGIAVLAGSLVTYALTGMLTAEPVLICALALTTLIRWVLGNRHSPRSAGVLAAAGTVLSVLIFGAAGLVRGTDWLIWGVSGAAAGVLAYCIRRVMMRFENGLPVLLHASDAMPFSVCCVMGMAALCSVRVFMVSFGGIAAGLLILTAARRYRAAGGVVCGTLCACAVLLAEAGAAGYAAMLPAAGFAAGALAGKKPVVQYAVMQAVCALGLALSGWSTAVAEAWMNGVIGGLLFLFLPSGTLLDMLLQYSDGNTDLNALTEARMGFLSHSIAGVRGSAERISNMLARNDLPEDAAAKVCDAVCSKCKSRGLCWEGGDDAVRRCFKALSAAAYSEPMDAPEGCLRAERVTEEFRRMKRQNAASRALAARLRDTRLLLFSQMRITEDLLRKAAQKQSHTYHRELTRLVTETLERFRIPLHAAAVSVSGSRRVLVELYLPAHLEADTEMICECLSDALGKPLECCGTESAGEEQRIILQSAGGYTVSTAAAQCAVHEDEPCGDCWDTFTDAEGAVYLVVSDGMGSGRHAAVDARIVVGNFRQLVQSGMDCEAVARMINAIMLTKSGEERFATLDVAKICTDTAAVTLYKYGAGPTMIKHGERITICQAASDPIGILPKTEPYSTVLKLERGDMLFLLSDGLDESLYPYIRQRLQQGGDLQSLTHTVCSKAQRDAKGAPRDDVTVLAAAITGTAIDER